MPNYKFGVKIEGCNDEYCIFRFKSCNERYCPLPIKLNPFCRAKNRSQCRGLFKFVEKDGNRYILYFCDGRKCQHFTSSMFSNKILKQFGQKYLTQKEIEKIFTEEDLKAKPSPKPENVLLDFVLKTMFSEDVAQRVYAMIEEG